MLQHLKFSLPDWILCILISIGLELNVVQSFLLPEALSRDVLRMAIISAVVIAVLILCSYNKATIIIAGVLVVGGIILILFLSYVGILQGFSEEADPEANSRLWYLIVVLCAALVYLCSRTKISSWVLLIVGMLCFAYFSLLEYTVYIWGALLFMFACGTWICFVGYRKNVMKVSSMRSAFGSTVAWSAGFALICLAIGSLLWWGIIRPLNPPTENMILITEYLQMERLERLGLIDEEAVFDSSLLSSWVNENYTRITDSMTENTDTDEQMKSNGNQQDDHKEDENAEDVPVSAADGNSNWITYDKDNYTTLIVLCIIGGILLIACIVLFLLRRKIWYHRKTKGLDDEAYIRFLFPWFLSRFRKMKLPKPMGDTPMEYARRMEVSTRFLDGTGISWTEITETFSVIAYGGRGPKPGDREKFEQFYHGFYRCCRKKYHLAWIWKSLRL